MAKSISSNTQRVKTIYTFKKTYTAFCIKQGNKWHVHSKGFEGVSKKESAAIQIVVLALFGRENQKKDL